MEHFWDEAWADRGGYRAALHQGMGFTGSRFPRLSEQERKAAVDEALYEIAAAADGVPNDLPLPYRRIQFRCLDALRRSRSRGLSLEGLSVTHEGEEIGDSLPILEDHTIAQQFEVVELGDYFEAARPHAERLCRSQMRRAGRNVVKRMKWRAIRDAADWLLTSCTESSEAMRRYVEGPGERRILGWEAMLAAQPDRWNAHSPERIPSRDEATPAEWQALHGRFLDPLLQVVNDALAASAIEMRSASEAS